MRSSFLPLLLIAALALVGTATATAENFQNGPGSFMTMTDPNLPFTAGATQEYHKPTSPGTVYDGMFTGIGGTPYGYLINGMPYTSNQIQFTPAGEMVICNTTPGALYMYSGEYVAYDQDMDFVGSSGGSFYYRNLNGYNIQNGVRLRHQLIDRKVYTWANDVLVVSPIASGKNYDSPAYWRLDNEGEYDDIIIGPATEDVVGAIPRDWYVAKDLVDPSMSGLYNPAEQNVDNTFMYASYSIAGDPVNATISIDGDHQIQAIPTPAIQIKDYNGVWQDTICKSGIIAFDLTEFEATKEYGRHTIEINSSSGTVEEEFWYKASATSGTEIEWDRDIYAPNDTIQVNTTIGSMHWLPGTYSYKAYIYDSTMGTEVASWDVTSQNQVYTTTASSARFPQSGEYLTVLYAVTSTGAEQLLDTDTCQVYTNKIVYSGTVYDAQQGTVLQGASVSVTQSGSTETQTTGSDGRFEFSGLEKDVTTNFNYSKTGYVPFNATSTFTEYKRYEVAIALMPESPEHTGEAVFGTVRSYPHGQTVESPAVRILHDGTLVDSTTGTAKGWYLFDGLTANETYTIEVDKEGYLTYSNAVVTGSGGNSLTEMDPMLTPCFSLTVNLKDDVTLAAITSQMAVVLGDGQSAQTTTGTVTFGNVSMGTLGVSVIGSGYQNYAATASMLEDRNETYYLHASSVVPTTAAPIVTTPTPAIVSLSGTVYAAMTGGTLSGANVSFTQGSLTRYATTDANGDYSIPNVQNGALSTINVSKADYTHTAFSFTLAGSSSYVVDLYMTYLMESDDPTHAPVTGKAGAGGVVLGGPYHELVESYAVTASNGTWSGTATIDGNHAWYFTDLEPGEPYTFEAAAAGYVTDSVEATTGAADTFTTVTIVLDQLYDITIRVRDADTSALILQSVEVVSSFGVTQTTTNGTTVFTNVQYGTWTFQATSDGYQQGGVSLLAYGDLAQDIYLSKAPTSGESSIEYSIPPKHVELVARNLFGVPLAGVAVSVQGQSTTLPDPDILGAIFGWVDDYSEVNLANATMTGTTGTDGAVSFLMTDSVKYLVHFTDSSRGIDQTFELQPYDTQYLYLLGATQITPSASMPNVTLWAEGADGTSPELHGYYSDPAGTTTSVRFIVAWQNGTELYSQTFASSSVDTSYTVNHTTGAQYVWGMNASTPDRGYIEQWSGITMHSRLIDLGIEEGYYFWISACFLFLFAAFFSGINTRFGFILLPLFAGFLWYVGWLATSPATIGLALVAGMLMYISRVQVG